MMTKYKNFLIAFSFIFLFLGSLPALTNAASLYFSPPVAISTVGETVTVNVYVSSTASPANAVTGVISFPTDKLEVVSISKVGSILFLWVVEPSFSNNHGTVSFEGIALNPGYTGTSGKIISITFKAKMVGTIPLLFTSSSVLANDGSGTNILTSISPASVQIGSAKPVTTKEIITTPLAPVITSSTHTDQNKWYAVKDAKFAWSLPNGITGVRLLVGNDPQAIPTVTYTTPISLKEIPNLSEGIGYFSARLRNTAGWGGTSNFKFQIDIEAPTIFEITEVQQSDTTLSKVKFAFKAEDKTSGIAYYEVQIDNRDKETWKGDGTYVYETPEMQPGDHILTAKAIDQAGNYLESFVEFKVEAIIAPSDTITAQTIVEKQSLFSRIKPLFLSLAVFIILVLLLRRTCPKFCNFVLFNEKLTKKIYKVTGDLHKVFNLLKDDIGEQIKKLEKTKTKRQLTAEEEKIMKQLKHDLDQAEVFIKKDIEDIAKDLK